MINVGYLLAAYGALDILMNAVAACRRIDQRNRSA
jgi:hypothetical protein